MSLLKEAKKIIPLAKRQQRLRSFKFEDLLELALAWVNNDITSRQMSLALKYKSPDNGSNLYVVATILRQAVQTGFIEIKIKKELYKK